MYITWFYHGLCLVHLEAIFAAGMLLWELEIVAVPPNWFSSVPSVAPDGSELLQSNILVPCAVYWHGGNRSWAALVAFLLMPSLCLSIYMVFGAWGWLSRAGRLGYVKVFYWGWVLNGMHCRLIFIFFWQFVDWLFGGLCLFSVFGHLWRPLFIGFIVYYWKLFLCWKR